MGAKRAVKGSIAPAAKTAPGDAAVGPPATQGPLSKKTSQAKSDPTIGLAFGGGGARGFAHIHVIAALEDLGLAPACISGTSIGSIMGAGLAAGMDARQMQDHVLDIFTDAREVISRFWQMRPSSVSEFLRGPRTMLGNVDAVKAVRAFLPGAVPANFQDLKTPLQVVATDFYAHAEVVIGEGDLYQAIGASCALPAVMRPVTRDGVILVDGGMQNAVPYELLFDKADVIIGVDVVGGPISNGRDLPTRFEAITGASQLLMQATTRLKCQQFPPNLLLRPPVHGIGVLNFIAARTILEQTAHFRDEAKREIERLLESEAASA
ncbi:MAG: patatin-like phospholipase family protein [Pseudomonadota bacterium]